MQNYCVVENGQLSNNFRNYIKVSGSFNYFACIEIKRKPGQTDSSISITCFSKPDRTIAIAASFRWLQNTQFGQYNLNMTANLYQCSPRDVETEIEVRVTPFEDGFTGECIIHYGPIKLDPAVEAQLDQAIKHNYLELNCEGSSRRSSYKFSQIKADADEVQGIDKNKSKLVDQARISKELMIDCSQIDSQQFRIVSPGNGRLFGS